MKTISETINKIQNSNSACLAMLFIVCFVSFGLPLLYGLPEGFDMIFDIRLATSLRDSGWSAHFFPGWADDNFGFGSIGIRFYPLLSMYTLALTEMVSHDWFGALWVNLLFWMFLGSTGMYFFVKEWGGPSSGLIAGITYAIIPQHLNEIFQFFLYAEFAAWAVTPFCFLFVTRICRNGTWKDVILFGVSYSLLILTHIPTTIIASLCLPVYVLVVMDWQNFKRVALHLTASVALTLAATSFRWLIIVQEVNWLAHNSEKYANGYFDYAAWLFPNVLATRSLFVYVLTSWLFDLSIIMTVALTIPALIWLTKTRTIRNESVWRIQAAAVATTLFAFFMLSRPSQFIWDNVTFLQKTQFPWRWLNLLSMGAVLAFALAIPRLMETFSSRPRLVAYPVLALLVTIVLFNVTQIIIPSAPIPKAEFGKVEKELEEEPVFEAWWPIWAKKEAFENPERVMAGQRTVEIRNWKAEEREFSVAAGDALSLRVATFYYPHWTAYVNGTKVLVEKDEFGTILIPVPDVASNVHLDFEEPIANIIATIVSSITWLLLLSFTAGYIVKRNIPSLTPFFQNYKPFQGFKRWTG